MKIRANVKVNGIVQGVGFRPFIHKQITIYSLLGWIRNTSEGAEIELEGEESNIDWFESDLWTKAPKLAVIESVHVDKFQDLKNYTEFKIIESKSLDEKNTLISPDVCICDDCLEEMFDPSNKRYRYPFINCTNCGPRFTIIKDVPYDRPKTTMGVFPMCDDCHKEYTDIEDRRYHAQPTCCPDCGPRLIFYDKDGKELEGDPIELAQNLIRDGKILAVKGLGGMHLACKTDNAEIADTLRRRKHRDEKPFAIMCYDADAARKLCKVTDEEEKMLTSFRRPIVLLEKKEKGSLSYVSENQYVGVMLPYTPVHYLLMNGAFDSLIMTSANLSDKPIMFKNEEALEELHGIADGFLLNNRDIETRCDDSLMYVVEGKEYPLRRSRGYVPFPVKLPKACKKILSCGAEQKATFSLSKGTYIFPSQHIGDLKNLETFDNYENQIKHFENIFDIKPDVIVCDMHPDYMSTAYAENRAKEDGIPLVKVQHHYAHMASCMADNKIEEPVIGVVWDGTGYGTDGTIWGGEFLLGDYKGYERKGRIKPITLPGGDKATEELDRVGISMLYEQGSKFDPEEIYEAGRAELIKSVLSMDKNCPKASSMGRLFDGMASILNIKQLASYEGQGAVLLEAASSDSEDSYPVTISEKDCLLEYDWTDTVNAVCEDLKAGKDAGVIAANFMNTMIAMAAEMCLKIREISGVNKVVLSGGTWQNMYMLKRIIPLLEEKGFDVYHHSRVSTNDEGLSLGQTMIANAMEF